MNFASRGASQTKVWRDIWGSGQGIGAVKEVLPVACLVGRLEREFAEAKQRLCTWPERSDDHSQLPRPRRRG
jgi:nitronate monooxygenase